MIVTSGDADLRVSGDSSLLSIIITRLKPGRMAELNKQIEGLIKISAEVETMAYVRVVPWHNKGVQVQSAMTAAEALKLGGLDWLAAAKPAYFPSRFENVPQPDGTLVSTPMDFKPIPYCVANVRMTDDKVLGVVTDRYQICQNHEAFDFLDGVIDKTGGAHYETAGMLYDDGEHRKRGRAFILAKMEGVEILGDVVEPYICLTNSFNKETGLQVALTPIRVVCNNTLQLAIDGAVRLWSTTHTGNLKDKMNEAQITLSRVKTYMEKMPDVATAMYNKEVFADEIPKILEAIFPLPDMPIDDISKVTIRNIEEKRQVVFNIYEQVPDIQKFEGCAWGLYQAITDFQQHYTPFDNQKGYKEAIFTAAINGDPIVARAQKILMSLGKK